jgi:hypothetical protein
MKDEIRPLHQPTQERRIGHASLDYFHSRLSGRLTKVLARTADEIVEHDDTRCRSLRQLVDYVGSKKAGPANDQDPSAVKLMQGCL